MNKFRIYNEDGKVKVTKVTPTGVEQVMYSDIKHEEFVEIEVDITTAIYSRKATYI